MSKINKKTCILLFLPLYKSYNYIIINILLINYWGVNYMNKFEFFEMIRFILINFKLHYKYAT